MARISYDSVQSHVENRVLAGRARNEDAAVLSFPSHKALVQTVDILAPIVNDPYTFGRIAAANALSDVYAMGGRPWCAMNMLFFPTSCNGQEGLDCVAEILRGGASILQEADAVLVGGHTVEDSAIKYGMSVTGFLNAEYLCTNDGLQVGDVLFLTKPLGTGILATGIKAQWESYEASEYLISHWCAKLNSIGPIAIETLKLKAATDITGFGLGGHSIEMAMASECTIVLESASIPLFENAYEYAQNGLIPAASHANRRYWQKHTKSHDSLDKSLESIIFDTQTSGGLLFAVHEDLVHAFIALLQEREERCWQVGTVQPKGTHFLEIV